MNKVFLFSLIFFILIVIRISFSGIAILKNTGTPCIDSEGNRYQPTVSSVDSCEGDYNQCQYTYLPNIVGDICVIGSRGTGISTYYFERMLSETGYTCEAFPSRGYSSQVYMKRGGCMGPNFDTVGTIIGWCALGSPFEYSDIAGRGYWDSSEKKLITCSNRREAHIYGTENQIKCSASIGCISVGCFPDYGDYEFESACGAHVYCDEKRPYDAVYSPPGYCDDEGNFKSLSITRFFSSNSYPLIGTTVTITAEFSNPHPTYTNITIYSNDVGCSERISCVTSPCNLIVSKNVRITCTFTADLYYRNYLMDQKYISISWVECRNDGDCYGYDESTKTKIVCRCIFEGCSLHGSDFRCVPKGFCNSNADCAPNYCCTDDSLGPRTKEYRCVSKGNITNKDGRSYICDPPEFKIKDKNNQTKLFFFMIDFILDFFLNIMEWAN